MERGDIKQQTTLYRPNNSRSSSHEDLTYVYPQNEYQVDIGEPIRKEDFKQQRKQRTVFRDQYAMQRDESHLLDQFEDKEFEANFNDLVTRLNKNLRHLNIPKQVDEIAEGIQYKTPAYCLSPVKKPKHIFKTSHISQIQSLYAHRDQYALRLREFDQFKSLQTNDFILRKMGDIDKSVRNMQNLYGPIKPKVPSFRSQHLDSSGKKGEEQTRNRFKSSNSQEYEEYLTNELHQQYRNINDQIQYNEREQQQLSKSQQSSYLPQIQLQPFSPQSPEQMSAQKVKQEPQPIGPGYIPISNTSLNLKSIDNRDIDAVLMEAIGSPFLGTPKKFNYSISPKLPAPQMVTQYSFQSEADTNSQVALIIPHRGTQFQLPSFVEPQQQQKLSMNQKIESQIKENQLKQSKFKQYYNNSKRIGKNGAPRQLTIDMNDRLNQYEVQHGQMLNDQFQQTLQLDEQQLVMLNAQSNSTLNQYMDNQIRGSAEVYVQQSKSALDDYPRAVPLQIRGSAGELQSPRAVSKNTASIHNIIMTTDNCLHLGPATSDEADEHLTLSPKDLQAVDPQSATQLLQVQQTDLKNSQTSLMDLRSSQKVLNTMQLGQQVQSLSQFQSSSEQIKYDSGNRGYMEKEDTTRSPQQMIAHDRSRKQLSNSDLDEHMILGKYLDQQDSRSEGDCGDKTSPRGKKNLSGSSPKIATSYTKRPGGRVHFGFTSPGGKVANSQLRLPSHDIAQHMILNKVNVGERPGRTLRRKQLKESLRNYQKGSQIDIQEELCGETQESVKRLSSTGVGKSSQLGDVINLSSQNLRVPVDLSKISSEIGQHREASELRDVVNIDRKLSKIDIKSILRQKVPVMSIYQQIESGHLAYRGAPGAMSPPGNSTGQYIQASREVKSKTEMKKLPKNNATLPTKSKYTMFQQNVSRNIAGYPIQHTIQDKKLVKAVQLKKASPYQAKIPGGKGRHFVQSPITAAQKMLKDNIHLSLQSTPQPTSITGARRASDLVTQIEQGSAQKDASCTPEPGTAPGLAVGAKSLTFKERIREFQSLKEIIEHEALLEGPKTNELEVDDTLVHTPVKQAADMNASTAGVTDQSQMVDMVLDQCDIIVNDGRTEQNSSPMQVRKEPQSKVHLNQLYISANLAIISSLEGFNKYSRKHSIEVRKFKEQELRDKFVKAKHQREPGSNEMNINNGSVNHSSSKHLNVNQQQLQRNKYSSVFKGKVKAYETSIDIGGRQRQSNSPPQFERSQSYQNTLLNEQSIRELMTKKSNLNINWQEASDKQAESEAPASGADIYDKMMKATIQGVSIPLQYSKHQPHAQSMNRGNAGAHSSLGTGVHTTQYSNMNQMNRALVHVQDSESGDAPKNPQSLNEDMKQFLNSDLRSQAPSPEVLSNTPSHADTNALANPHRRYKQSKPREIYSSALKENEELLKQNQLDKEFLGALMQREEASATKRRNKKEPKQMATLGMNSLLTLEEIENQPAQGNQYQSADRRRKAPFLSGAQTTVNSVSRQGGYLNHVSSQGFDIINQGLPQRRKKGTHIHIKSGDISQGAGVNPNQTHMRASYQTATSRNDSTLRDHGNQKGRVEVQLMNTHTSSRNPSNTTVLPVGVSHEDLSPASRSRPKQSLSQKQQPQNFSQQKLKWKLNDASNTDLHSELNGGPAPLIDGDDRILAEKQGPANAPAPEQNAGSKRGYDFKARISHKDPGNTVVVKGSVQLQGPVPFFTKQILIDSPWETGAGGFPNVIPAQEQLKQLRRFSNSQLGQMPSQKAKGQQYSGGFKAGAPMLTQAVAFRGFNASPMATQYSKDKGTRHGLHQRRDAKGQKYKSHLSHGERASTLCLQSSDGQATKIQGFSNQSNVAGSSVYRKSLARMGNHLETHYNKDFTIEERLNEESFVSNHNLTNDAQTIQQPDTLANNTSENYGITSAIRMTMHGTTQRATDQTQARLNEVTGDKIKIEHNLDLIMASSLQSASPNSNQGQ